MTDRVFTINTFKARRLLGALGRSLEPAEVNLILARSINRTTVAARVAAIREIKKTYRVKSRDFNKASKKNGTGGNSGVTKATRMRPTGSVNVWGSPMPVRDFGARQNKRGVTLNIKGKRQFIKSAFFATMPSGYRGVYARGRYGATGFVPGKKRQPISKIVTTSQGVMFSEPTVMKRSLDRTDEIFPKRLEHEINFLVAGLYKKGSVPQMM